MPVRLSFVTERLGPETCAIALAGELDLYTCPEFKQELMRVIGEGARAIVVDLSATTFIDSTALGVLLRAMQHLRQRDSGTLSLVITDPSIRRIFEVTGLDRVFPIFTSRVEAAG